MSGLAKKKEFWLFGSALPPGTVIKNGKFSTIILYDNKRVILCHCCIPLNFLDFKDLKKLKKTNEGHKGQIKGQNVSNTNSLYFLGIVGFIWKY